ncbi:unnamed protein product [Mytilus edulis]|uniref:Uncharacterized protein n=1 Tax=Mytilus edulis TaxID=6550 RepID=A0A8S3Q9Y1_MYTED|nr:unnamed protein product [Mytilus edulis]
MKSAFPAALSVCAFQSSEMAAKMEISDIDFLNVIPQWDNSKDDLTFGLRGVDEHRNLSVDQFELGKDQTGSYYIIQGQSQQNVQRSNICDDKPWFNAQCKDLHRRYINCLNIFNRLKSQLNHSNLIRAKKDYKTLERRLKQEYMRTEGNMLDIMRLTNPKLFYKKFKRKASSKHAVPLKLFHEHFKSLCSSDTDAVLDDSQFNNTDVVKDTQSFSKYIEWWMIDKVVIDIQSGGRYTEW